MNKTTTRKNKILSPVKQAGVGLFEIMLVLTVMAFITLVAVQQYQGYRREADIALVKSNIDNIFEAMRAYYFANCSDETVFPAYDPNLPAYYNGDQSRMFWWGQINPYMPYPYQTVRSIISPDDDIFAAPYEPIYIAKPVPIIQDGVTVGTGLVYVMRIALNLQGNWLQDDTSEYATRTGKELGALCMKQDPITDRPGMFSPCDPSLVGTYAIFERAINAPNRHTINDTNFMTMPLLRSFKLTVDRSATPRCNY